MTADSSSAQPLTFNELLWVKEIDTLSSTDWLRSNPDGSSRLSMIHTLDVRPEAIELIAEPLRNLVKLMLDDILDTEGKDSLSGMRSLIKALSNHQFWQDIVEDDDCETVLGPDLEHLRRDFPAAPLTFKCFLEHFRADAEYHQARFREKKAQSPDQPNA
jgi:hypothetical protein